MCKALVIPFCRFYRWARSYFSVPTKPIEGQKTGTSGLRKKVTLVEGTDLFIENWVQSLFLALGDDLKGKTLVVGGDGRYLNDKAAQQIVRIAAGNGVQKVIVGQNALLSTPALSAVVRERQVFGGIIMTASHNPAGPKGDFGIKYNSSNGGPAQESLTDVIFEFTKTITEIRMADLGGDVDLSTVGVKTFEDFEVEVIDPAEIYVALMKQVFDFDSLKAFALSRKEQFSMLFDAMHAVTGPYAKRVFVDELGIGTYETTVANSTPLPDFAGGHPDPNLTYAAELVAKLTTSKQPEGARVPIFGAASDGDGDRNMILGKDFFVSPSDSVAIIADYAFKGAIPYYLKNGLKGAARSMPTSQALDVVGQKLGFPVFETPTGWKFFGNLMDAGKANLCGEESFGTSGDHIREKDGIWAVLCWLSILEFANRDTPAGAELVGIKEIAEKHWKTYGRHFYTRCDYEEVDSEGANKMMDHLRGQLQSLTGQELRPGWKVRLADEYRFVDSVDGSVAEKQGIRIMFESGSRMVFRLSGTGSAGATIRLYMEHYEPDFEKLASAKPLVEGELFQMALEVSKLAEFTGRSSPSVIT